MHQFLPISSSCVGKRRSRLTPPTAGTGVSDLSIRWQPNKLGRTPLLAALSQQWHVLCHVPSICVHSLEPIHSLKIASIIAQGVFIYIYQHLFPYQPRRKKKKKKRKKALPTNNNRLIVLYTPITIISFSPLQTCIPMHLNIKCRAAISLKLRTMAKLPFQFYEVQAVCLHWNLSGSCSLSMLTPAPPYCPAIASSLSQTLGSHRSAIHYQLITLEQNKTSNLISRRDVSVLLCLVMRCTLTLKLCRNRVVLRSRFDRKAADFLQTSCT